MTQPKRVKSMADIARLTGLSRHTVSAVLNDRSWVSEKTRKRVLETVKKYNYSPNRLATNLLGKSSNLIGVIIRDVLNPFYSKMIRGICDALRERGFHMMFFDSQDVIEDEAEAVRTLMSYRISGLIIAPIQTADNHEHLQALMDYDIPLVSIGAIPGINSHKITFKDVETGYIATRHLLDNGHTNICCLMGPPHYTHALERFEGFRKALDETEIEFNKNMVVGCGLNMDTNYAAAMEILARGAQRPTGVVCYNDLVALSIYKAANSLGLQIPEDVSVIGCDDIPMAAVLGPPLTTIQLPVSEIGVEAAEILVQCIKGEVEDGCIHRIFQPRLITRSTVKKVGDPVERVDPVISVR